MLLKSELLSARSLLFQLNKCNQRDNLLEIDFWIPEAQNENLLAIVDSIKKEHSYTAIELQKEDIKFEKPPSHFSESGFFNQFQEIVNTYGIPSYKEINPAVFTSVTFPFLFGVMFGDIAHGSVLFVFSLYLLCNSLSISNNLKIRHLTIKSLGITLCFMGFFSMYAGVIYNDFLALPVTVNPSCYELQGDVYGNFVNF
jgi:V-type H+-transporting ATPase subunit a